MSFATVAQLPLKEIFGGQIQGRYFHLDQLTFGVVRLKAGTVVPRHQHPHEQISYIVSGRVEFSVGPDTRTLGPGMTAAIPGGVEHGVTVHTDTEIIDVFSPARDDYR